MAAARCPNCTRKIHIWNNHTGFCSKRCREESKSACLNCGKIGLFKHERLGCCSDECRYWYVTTLLGYDREFLLTPAWDKVVYHVRLPSANAEISSLQLDELEFERARDTILVVAAPPWIARQKVLAELPYARFDNAAWQHLRVDGTLSSDEVERFRGMCYDDPLLYHKLGVHVFEKIRGQGGTSPITPPTSVQLAPGSVSLTQPMLPIGMFGVDAATSQTSVPLQLAQVSQVATSLAAPEHFASQVRTLFALRGFQVSSADPNTDTALLLSKGSKRAIAVYHWQHGMVSEEPVRVLLDLMTTWEASNGYVVTNGHFTLQVEDLVVGRAVQLIDGDQFAALVDGTHVSAQPATTIEQAPGTPEAPEEGGGTAATGYDARLNGHSAYDDEIGTTKVLASSTDRPEQVTRKLSSAEPVGSGLPDADTSSRPQAEDLPGVLELPQS